MLCKYLLCSVCDFYDMLLVELYKEISVVVARNGVKFELTNH